MLSFLGFLNEEIKNTLKKGDVFKTRDKTGDLANQLIYVKSIMGNEITIITSDGTEATTSVKLLNVDLSSVRPYDKKKDPKFL